jgi:hypothetical protein
MTDLVPRKLTASSEFIVTTNLKTPLKITGVASTRIRDSKNDPWRDGYMVLYEDCGSTKKAEINQELYSALHLVFDTLGNIDENTFVVDDDMEFLPVNEIC